MKARAIHQFHSGSAYGDAVTNSLLFTQKLLREFGFQSEIFVEHIADELVDQLKHYTSYKGSKDQVLLVHHSLGHDLTDWLLNLPDVKILVYHNITPSEFFPKESLLYKYSQIGREQLKIFKQAMVGSICDSEYNAEELQSLEYKKIFVIPLLIDIENITKSDINYNVIESNSGIFSILFVGRLSPNKCQHDIIEVFRDFITMVDQPTQLVLVGGYEEHDLYYQHLQQLVYEYGLTEYIKIVGKVSQADLYGWYSTADVFISMSEHEGFGVPIIESMIFDVPVVAYKSSNIAYTLGEGGVLFREKNFREIAALINIIRKDRAFCRNILTSQRKRIQDFSRSRLQTQLIQFLEKVGIETPKQITLLEDKYEPLSFQIEGPFETNYSLAIVNRELAFALDKTHPERVALFATEGPGDYQPDIKAIQEFQGLDLLWKPSRKRSKANVVIRNLYPPRVADMDGLINLFYFGWEESNIPTEWVESFNRYLDGFTVLSSFVKKVLIDSGVYVPIKVAGCGVEQVLHQKREKYNGNLGKSFRFLHVSSCFPRKGIDVLLQAYVQAFTSDDDVSLVIKTFPNIHNNVEEQIEILQKNNDNSPDIVLINEDIPVSYMIDIYHRCHVLVAPSRGEGFGLPMAEAMLFGLPVITTAFGGHTDFCTQQTAWLIDFKFEQAKSHLSAFNSVWAEPDVNHLAQMMREIYVSPKEKLQAKVDAAKTLIERDFTWACCASRVQKTVSKISSQKPLAIRNPTLGWVTTWNSKCGIAAYSGYLLNNGLSDNFNVKILASGKDTVIRPDESNVIRCWDDISNPNLSDLEQVIYREGLEAVVIQFNFGFFEINSFGNLISSLARNGVKTIINFHSTKDVDKPELKVSLKQIIPQLSLADRLFVHSISDINRLKEFGLINNVALLPHGVNDRQEISYTHLKTTLNLMDKRVIASYGFLLPDKGIEELITAFHQINKVERNSILLLVNAFYPNPISYELGEKCKKLIDSFNLDSNVVMISDFLEDEESLCILESADIIVFPYQKSNESSSAAVRTGLSSNRPVACTPMQVFDDVKDVVHSLPGTSPNDIANGIMDLLTSDVLLNSKHDIQQMWLRHHSWKVISRRLSGTILGLMNEAIT